MGSMAGTERNISVQPVGPLDLGKSSRRIEEEREAEDIKVQHVQEHIIMTGKSPTTKDGVKLEKKLEPIVEEPEKQVDETTTITPTTEKNNIPTVVIEDSRKSETIDEEEKELENGVPPHTPLLGTSKLDYYPEYEKVPQTQKTFNRRTSGWGYYPDYERPPSNFPLSRKGGMETGESQSFWTLATSNFLPIWFTVTMGTGTVPMVLHQQALQFSGLDIIIFILFGLNTMIFLLFTGLTITRYIIWPAKFKEVIYDPVDSLFIGTFPMGLSTLINSMAFMVAPKTGPTFHTFLWVMWIFDAVLSVVCILYISFQIMSQHPADLQQITAAWLLPILPGLVSASAGGNVAQILSDDSRVLTTILVCYVLIGISFPLGLMVVGLYFARLALYKLPPRAAIPSTFLPIALGAQTALGLVQLAKVARVLLPRMAFLDGQAAGEVWYAGSLIISLGLWASSASWLVWALASTFQRRIYFFSMGWWAFTFPLGIFAGATISLGKEFASIVFDVLGSVLVAAVVIVWFIVFVKTLKSFMSAEFFQ